MAETTITTKAKKKMLEARAGIAALPKIAGMVFGDGEDNGGMRVLHSPDQKSLHHELLRKAVDGYEVVSDTKIRYFCTLKPGRIGKCISSEAGLYDAEGDLVAMKAFMKKGKDSDMAVIFECEDTLIRKWGEWMADYDVIKELHLQIKKLETSDPVHASVFNAIFEKMIGNDAYLSEKVDLAYEHIRKKTGNPHGVTKTNVG